MRKIADAGLLIAFLDPADPYHLWAAKVFEAESPPFYTAEPVLAEAAAVLGNPDPVLSMLESEDLVLNFALAKEFSTVRALVAKYRDQPMDLGDACCVRMSELIPDSVVYTIDKKDFSVYRKHGRQPVPCIFGVRS
jgi:uncharacterized protein